MLFIPENNPSDKSIQELAKLHSILPSSILILRGFLFLPLPYMLFISLQNITLPEWTTLNMISPILGSILAILFLGENNVKKLSINENNNIFSTFLARKF